MLYNIPQAGWLKHQKFIGGWGEEEEGKYKEGQEEREGGRRVREKEEKEIYFLMFLDARRPRSRCQLDHRRTEGTKEGSVPGPSPSFW